MNETRRLFISTNVNSIDGLLGNKRKNQGVVSKFLGFGNCWPKDEYDENIDYSQNEIASFHSNNKVFVNNCENCTTLFLVLDSLESLPKCITINKVTDYLLYHESKTREGIKNLFDETHRKSSHHQKNEPLDEAFKIIINDEITHKAEVIIEKLFVGPDIRMEGLNLLGYYLKTKPTDECPDVFKGMEEAYNALKNCSGKIKGDEYTKCLSDLRDAFVKHYYETIDNNQK